MEDNIPCYTDPNLMEALMEKVDLGVFQPLAFFKAIGKNMVNFLTPGPAIFPKITPVATTAVSDYSISNILAQPALDLKIRPPDITLFETTLVKPDYKITFEELMPKFLSTPVVTTGNIFTQILDTLQVPLQKVTDFLLDINKMKTAKSIAQSQADTQRASQAVVEAQERIYTTQIQQEKEAQGILSTEAWKKATPYVIPVAAGLAIVALLLVVGKGGKKKK